MKKIVSRRYWDSAVFLAWLKNEGGKADQCTGVIRLAEQGKVTIITSALTLAEVIKLKGKTKISKKDEITVTKFFENDYIAVRSVDRIIAESARHLVWANNIDPKDSIHIATALNLKLTVFDTFDGFLMKHTLKLGNKRLRIGKPDISEQIALDLIAVPDTNEETE